MLNEEVIDKVVERLLIRIEKTNTYILTEMGKSIKKIGTLTPSQAQQLVMVLKYGGDFDKIVKKIAQITDKNVYEIYEIFDEIAKNDYRFAKQFYAYRNKNYIPYAKNKLLQEQVRALASITAGEYLNLTRTNALGFGLIDKNGEVIFKGLKDTYYNLLDEAVLSVSQGKETFDSAMYRQLKQIGESGLKVVYESGRTMRLDSAVRMNLKSGLTQLHMEMQQTLGKDFDSDGVEISVHNNPAPDHEEAQGKQFSNGEFAKLQETGIAEAYDGTRIDMITYNSFRPIGTMNCYHYIFSIVLGVSKPQYTNKQLQEIRDNNNKGFELDGEHYTNYEGTQMQRGLERRIREQQEAQLLGKSSGNQELIDKSTRKLKALNNRYNELNKASGLPTKINRIKTVQPAKEKSKKTYINYLETKYYKDNMNRFMENEDNEYLLINKLDKVAKDEDEANTMKAYIQDYTNENAFYNYRNINSSINRLGLENTSGDIQNRAKLIQKAIDGNEIQDDIYVYRVVDKNDFIKDGKNYYIQNKGFTSTSALENVDIDFMDGEDKVKLKIKVDKGTKGLFIGEDTFAMVNEQEILFGLDTRIDIEDIDLKKKLLNAKMRKK